MERMLSLALKKIVKPNGVRRLRRMVDTTGVVNSLIDGSQPITSYHNLIAGRL